MFLLGGDQTTANNPNTGSAVPGLVALDTTIWTWVYPDVPGLPAVPFVYSTLTLFKNSKLITALGIFISNYLLYALC